MSCTESRAAAVGESAVAHRLPAGRRMHRRARSSVEFPLACRGVEKRFRAGVPGCVAQVRALAGLDLVVREGELVELQGAPGAGKTTLLLCAAGLLAPDVGMVCWFGRPQQQSVCYIPDPLLPPGDSVRWQLRQLVDALARGTRFVAFDITRARGDGARALREELGRARHRGTAVLAASNGFDLGPLPRRALVLAHGRLAREQRASCAMSRHHLRAGSPRVAESG